MATTVFDESERRIWAGRARAYAQSFAHLCAYPIPLLLDAAHVRPGDRVLDVGTGAGAVVAAASARGADVVAVDADPDMAVLARRNAPQADVRLAALPRLPFADDEFDAVAGNFVLNHVGRPRSALAELKRITRPGGRVAVTIWARPPGAGQALVGRAVEASGARRPADLPALRPEDDFPRTGDGLAALMESAGLEDAGCRTLAWKHRVDTEVWWAGHADGVGTIGQTVARQTPAVTAEIRRHYLEMSGEFAVADGILALPHTALLAHARA
ncbi:class I SAM-dependent methyltransferase [Streptomyces meridianus]|uniref:Class I SAM-dependent methyltransferase n=1 Tax=Streptomyces meridianus TaxID=2938945 RepID=A0ABT0X960_9ACTN|nr:class I SAM-dependent methyltransferase [Streptomyces meridianus]MCM2578954.1 class I SAM-dependent methyltransferase [Streptomyces meridianus]